MNYGCIRLWDARKQRNVAARTRANWKILYPQTMCRSKWWMSNFSMSDRLHRKMKAILYFPLHSVHIIYRLENELPWLTKFRRRPSYRSQLCLLCSFPLVHVEHGCGIIQIDSNGEALRSSNDCLICIPTSGDVRTIIVKDILLWNPRVTSRDAIINCTLICQWSTWTNLNIGTSRENFHPSRSEFAPDYSKHFMLRSPPTLFDSDTKKCCSVL